MTLYDESPSVWSCMNEVIWIHTTYHHQCMTRNDTRYCLYSLSILIRVYDKKISPSVWKYLNSQNLSQGYTKNIHKYFFTSYQMILNGYHIERRVWVSCDRHVMTQDTVFTHCHFMCLWHESIILQNLSYGYTNFL